MGSSDDAIVSKNLDGVITSWNSGAERLFGYSAQEAVGQPITMLIPKERYDEETTILGRIRRGERIDHFETVRQRKDGELIVVSLVVSPVKNAKGEIVGASKIARDITEQRRSQEKIGMLAREAEHRSKNMLANVQAIVNLSRSDTPDGLKKAIEGRIRALSNVHSLFVATRWSGADLSTIAKQELLPYAGAVESRVRNPGRTNLLWIPRRSPTCTSWRPGFRKYGSLSSNDGRVDLTWSREVDGALQLRWFESGGPKVMTPTRRGFGGKVIEQMVAQLGGEVRFNWRARSRADIALPAQERARAGWPLAHGSNSYINVRNLEPGCRSMIGRPCKPDADLKGLAMLAHAARHAVSGLRNCGRHHILDNHAEFACMIKTSSRAHRLHLRPSRNRPGRRATSSKIFSEYLIVNAHAALVGQRVALNAHEAAAQPDTATSNVEE